MKSIIHYICIRILPLIAILLLPSVTASGQRYETKALRKGVMTLRTSLDGSRRNDFPLMALGGDGLTFSFDEIDGGERNYNYRIVHCNADWSKSDLSDMEWCEGFATNEMPHSEVSMNTTMNYVHYEVRIPNEDVSLKVSGNYAMVVYDADEPDSVACVMRFYVSEQSAMVTGGYSGDTRREIRGRYQELSFDVSLSNLEVRDVKRDIRTMVMQNGREDTRRWLSPSYISGNRLSFKNSEDLVYEGGNEYRSCDISSRYSYGGTVEKVRFYDPYYHVELMADNVRKGVPYVFENDVDGRFVVNVQEYDEDDLNSDYYFVHFFVPTDAPLFGGRLYVIGDFNQNRMDERSRMIYDVRLGGYVRTLLMKQGGYNYMYAYVSNADGKVSVEPIEGSHWETENEYQVMVYYRGFSDRSDRLVAARTIVK